MTNRQEQYQKLKRRKKRQRILTASMLLCVSFLVITTMFETTDFLTAFVIIISLFTLYDFGKQSRELELELEQLKERLG